MSLLVKEAKIQLLDVPVEPLFDNFRCQIAGGQVVVAVTWPVGHTIRRYTSRRNAEAGREQKVRLVEYVSKALLAATDDQDLADRIEDLLDDQEYSDLLESAESCSPQLSIVRRLIERAPEPRDRMPHVTRIVGESTMRYCDRLLAVTLRANAAAAATVDGVDDNTDESIPSLGMPSEILRALYGHRVATLSVFALRAADNAKADPRIVTYLIQRMINGLKDYLRLLDGFPGVEIPFDLIPAQDRIDFVDLFSRHAAAEKGYQATLSEARRQGATAFPPVSKDEYK